MVKGGFLNQGACLSFNHQAARAGGGKRHHPEPSVSMVQTPKQLQDTPKQSGVQCPVLDPSFVCLGVCSLFTAQPSLLPVPRHRALEATVQRAVNITSTGMHQFARTRSIFLFTKAFLWFWLGAGPEPQKLAGPAHS